MQLKEVINGQKIDRSWINKINPDEINLYPIQFANCDRMWWNDCVYIFDEVGSGKTISSGLMALDYLYNNRDNNKRVLIVTINALSKKPKSSENGQFLKDWFGKLPFDKFKFEERVDITNNHYSNLEKLADSLEKSSEQFGLIIIDEAHLFLNANTARTMALEKLFAEKVVFMTATPKDSILNGYFNIASCILKKPQDDDYTVKELLKTSRKNGKELICSLFDVKYPITRYFKDTIQFLKVADYEEKARRLLPTIWEYECNFQDGIGNDIVQEPKIKKLIDEINKIIDSSSEYSNRFVVFVRQVDKEANPIKSAFEKVGFQLFSKELSRKTKSYAVVTGNNSEELVNYKGNGEKDNLPTVLILTYQVAEQGVNLPGFNYVINYHVPSDPTALEQRFGRIDRMDSAFSEIHFVFLISKNGSETDYFNFSTALLDFLINILAYFPSRNIIFTKKFVEHFYDAFISEKEFKFNSNHLRKLLENLTEEIFLKMKERKDPVEDLKDAYYDLALFCEKRDVWLKIPDNIEMGEFKNYVKEEIDTVENTLISRKKVSNLGREFIKRFAEEVEFEISDKIFYRKQDYDCLATVLQVPPDSIGKLDVIECGKYIAESKSYQEFSEKFKKMVGLPLKITECRHLLERNLIGINNFFEEKFMENDLDSIFEDQSSSFHINRKTLRECIQSISDLKENCNLIMAVYVQCIENSLPIFKMFGQFKKILREYLFTEDSIHEDCYSVFWERLGMQVLENGCIAFKDPILSDLYEIYYRIAVKREIGYRPCDLSLLIFIYGKNTIKKDGTPLIADEEKWHIENLCYEFFNLRFRKNEVDSIFCKDSFSAFLEELGNQVLKNGCRVYKDPNFGNLLEIHRRMLVEKDFQYHYSDLSFTIFNYGRNTLKKDGTPLVADSEEKYIDEICFKAFDLKYRRDFIVDPFKTTMERITANDSFFRVSKKFADSYWDYRTPKKELFYIEVRNEKAIASNWYRLAYKFLQDNCTLGKSFFQHYMITDYGKFRNFVERQYHENCSCEPFPNDTLTKGICDCMSKFYKK